MTTNTELMALGLNSTEAVTLPNAIRVPAGKGFKNRIDFGQGAASGLRKLFKSKGQKGKALTASINAVLTGEKTLREQLAVAYTQSCFQRGMIASHAEETKGGAKLVFVAPVQTKVEVQSVETDYENMSADEINDLLHKLEAILDRKAS